VPSCQPNAQRQDVQVVNFLNEQTTTLLPKYRQKIVNRDTLQNFLFVRQHC
jgi:hypothetical protein